MGAIKRPLNSLYLNRYDAGSVIGATMKRREFISCICGAAAWPITARAQSKGRMPKVGVLMSLSEGDDDSQKPLTFLLALPSSGLRNSPHKNGCQPFRSIDSSRSMGG